MGLAQQERLQGVGGGREKIINFSRISKVLYPPPAPRQRKRKNYIQK